MRDEPERPSTPPAARAEAALREQLERIQREPVSDEVAGVGYEFLDRSVARVRQVTAADVQRLAQRHRTPFRAVIVEPPTKR